MGYTITVPGPADLQSNFFSLSSSINQIPFKCYVDPLSNYETLQRAERMIRQSKKDNLVCCSANTLWVFSLTESCPPPSPPPEFTLTEVTTGLFIPSTLASTHSPPPYYHPFILAVTRLVAHNFVTTYNYMPLGPLLVAPCGYIVLVECQLTSSGHLVVTPSCWDAKMTVVDNPDQVTGKQVFLSPTGVVGIVEQEASPSREDASYFSDALYFATGVKLRDSTKYARIEVQGIQEAVVWPAQLCFILSDDHKLSKPQDPPISKSSPLDEIYQALVCAKTFSRIPESEASIPSSTGATVNGRSSVQSTVTSVVYPTPPEQAYTKTTKPTTIPDAPADNFAEVTDVDGDTQMESVYTAGESLTPGLRWSSTPGGGGGIGTDTWDSMNEELFGNDNEITEADFNFFNLPDSGGGMPTSNGPLETSNSPGLEPKSQVVSAPVAPSQDEKMTPYSEQQLLDSMAAPNIDRTQIQQTEDQSQTYIILPDGRRAVKTDFDYITISPDPSEMLDKKYVLGGRFYITKKGLSEVKPDHDYSKSIIGTPRTFQIMNDDEDDDDASSMTGEDVEVAESDVGDNNNNDNNNNIATDEVLDLPLQILGHGIPSFVPMSASDYSAFLARTSSNDEDKDISELQNMDSTDYVSPRVTLNLEKSCQKIVHLDAGDPWEYIRLNDRPVFSLNVDVSSFASVLDIVVSQIIQDDELTSCILPKPFSKVPLFPSLISSVENCLGPNARVLSLGDISRLEEAPTGGISFASRSKTVASSPFMLRGDEHLGKLANSASRTTSRFNSPLFSSSPGTGFEGQESDPIKLLDPPKFMVRRGDYNMELSPYGLRFWETLGLTPIEGAKNLTAFMLYPDKNRLSSLCSFFLDYLKSTYEAANCGTFNFGSIDEFEKGLVPLSIPNSQSEKVSLTSSLFQICTQLGKSMGSQSQFSVGNNVIMIAYPVDSIPDLFTICSAYRELSVAFSKEASTHFENYDVPVLQIIPLSFFAPPSYPLVPPRYHIFRLCLRIYDKCLIEEKSNDDNPVSETTCLSPLMLALSKRKFLPKITHGSVTGINSAVNITASNNNNHESPPPSVNQEDGVFTYLSRRTPFATIAKPRDVKIKFATGQPAMDKLDSARLHVAYGKSSNKKWATACWTNLHGDMLDIANIPLVTKSAFPKSCEDVCVDIWNHTADIIASMRSSWTVVITRLGELDTDELNVWMSLTNHLVPNVELCLVSVNPNPSLSLQPASVTVRETESAQPGAPLTDGSNEMSPAFPQRYYDSPELYGATPTGSGMIVTTPGSGTPTPATYGSEYNSASGGEGDKDGFKLDKDTLLVDMDDRAYGILTRLVSFRANDGEWQPCLAKAYMVKPGGSGNESGTTTTTTTAAADDSMLTTEVTLVHCSKMPPNCDVYLMNILCEFRDLASLGQVKGIDVQKTSVGPMHVSIVEKVLRFLESLP